MSLEFLAKKLNRLKNMFLSGLVVTFPIATTILVVSWVFNFFDSILKKPISIIFKNPVPGVGILCTILLILCVGAITTNVIGKSIANYVEKLFLKTPIIKTIYSPIKEILKNIANKSSQSFKKVVMVDFPMEGKKSIGFVTNENLIANGKRMHSVFVPTTPNPTSGFMILVEANDYEVLNMSMDDALKLIVSIGTVSNE